MSALPIALGLSLLGSLGGLLVASTLLLFKSDVRQKLIPWLVSYAVGTLLGVALMDLLPESLEALPPATVFGTLLAGILAFFVFEKLVLWRHCHADHCEMHQSAAPLILVGDAVHNFIDGAVIAAATAVSVPLGVTTAIAVATHEIPQEVGDFAILLGAGYSRLRALWLNVLSGVSAVAGVLLAGLAIEHTPKVLPYFLPVAAASFLYVAMSDLIPSLHRGPFERNSLRQILAVAAGIATALML
ncbi:MAG: ZIP family metal transporter [Vicinamibacterales bacterium]|nr:ZIP family metal transporter [Vicinamibacterales bacterium]